MNKLKILSSKLNSFGLTKEASAIFKFSQSDPGPTEENDYSYDEPEERFDDWMEPLPRDGLILVSPGPISEVKDMSGNCKRGWKPVGLWYANGTEWLEFLKYNMPDWMEKVNYIYKINPNYSSGGLDGNGGVLKLSTEEEVIEFSKEYGVDPYGSGSVDHANWSAVARRWDGIEIIPYQYSLRMGRHTGWYYTWDVGSGCIWRPNGVSSLELISSRPGK